MYMEESRWFVASSIIIFTDIYAVSFSGPGDMRHGG